MGQMVFVHQDSVGVSSKIRSCAWVHHFSGKFNRPSGVELLNSKLVSKMTNLANDWHTEHRNSNGALGAEVIQGMTAN